ncbi:ATP-grasp domain-containing protein [Winogradskya humida]|uniref:ATP-grasp domain-containing protein n=1 Tax=Winogradskya humida TaxID=113566 RepID=A0ABQ3ZYB8_9ACTN|nr:hypothetical protein [Actinoplanes humidus]GIE23582.1 hypothetical protein Ahu01nite_066840 [Actinoplanes humidus]
MKPHVVHVGFYESYADAVDFDACNVTLVVDRYAAGLLSDPVRAKFAAIAVLDVPDRIDMDDYDRAFDQIESAVRGFAGTFGTPDAVVAVYEHTTLPAARLRDVFGVPGTDLRTALLCRDKVAMKQALRGVVRTPRFWAVDEKTTPDRLAEIVARIPGKVVLKPRSQAAGFGVRVFDSGHDLLDHVRTEPIGAAHEIEEFIGGTIGHTDGVVRDGQLHFFSASDYYGDCYSTQHHNAPLGSVTVDDPERVARLSAYTSTVLKALGLRDSAFHLELFTTPDDDLVFLEIANRFGGGYIRQHVRTAYGIDLADEAVRACTGTPSSLPGPATHRDVEPVPGGASGALWAGMEQTSDPCRVQAVHGVETLPVSVLHADLPEVGQVLNDGRPVFHTTGTFVIAGPSSAAVRQDMEHILKTYSIDVREEAISDAR